MTAAVQTPQGGFAGGLINVQDPRGGAGQGGGGVLTSLGIETAESGEKAIVTAAGGCVRGWTQVARDR
jgi:hypothetical protein